MTPSQILVHTINSTDLWLRPDQELRLFRCQSSIIPFIVCSCHVLEIHVIQPSAITHKCYLSTDASIINQVLHHKTPDNVCCAAMTAPTHLSPVTSPGKSCGGARLFVLWSSPLCTCVLDRVRLSGNSNIIIAAVAVWRGWRERLTLAAYISGEQSTGRKGGANREDSVMTTTGGTVLVHLRVQLGLQCVL